MKIVSLMRILTASVGWSLSVHAAQITNESFAAGANGWVGSMSPFANGEWVITGQVAEVFYYDVGDFALPENAVLSNQPTASSGSFTGDLDAASIQLFGFSILSNNSVVDTNNSVDNVRIQLGWTPGTSILQRIVAIPSVSGVWHHVAVSLADRALGGWTIMGGSNSDFSAARMNVKYFTLRIDRRGPNEHHFYVDDVFLDRLPAATDFSAGGSTGLVTWSYLRSNTAYRVERADQSTNLVWSTLETLTATGATHVTVDPALDTNLYRVYRMVIE